jgi:hypothetical protein
MQLEQLGLDPAELFLQPVASLLQPLQRLQDLPGLLAALQEAGRLA